MKIRTLLLLALVAPIGLNAATVLFPATTVTANSPAPTAVAVSVLDLATVALDTTTPGSTTSGAYSAGAIGGVKVALLPVLFVPSLGNVALSTRTEITSTRINFNTHTDITGVVGGILTSAPLLSNIIGAGLAPQWQASFNLSSLGLNFTPSTDYALTFNLTQSTSLLGNLSPAVLSRISASVGDNGGILPAQVLGLTDLVGSAGTVTLNFRTDPTIDGPVIARFGGSALLDTDLLGSVLGTPNSTLYSISNININPIPEPSTWALTAIFAGSMVFRRRR